MKSALHISQRSIHQQCNSVDFLSKGIMQFFLLCFCFLFSQKGNSQEQASAMVFQASENETVFDPQTDERTAFEIITDSISNNEFCHKQLQLCNSSGEGNFHCVEGQCKPKCKKPLIYCPCNKICMRYQLCERACANFEHRDPDDPIRNGPRPPVSHDIPERPLIPDNRPLPPSLSQPSSLPSERPKQE